MVDINAALIREEAKQARDTHHINIFKLFAHVTKT